LNKIVGLIKLTAREESKTGTMRNIATKYLVWILAAWIGSGCMTLLADGFAAEHQPAGLTSVEYRAADLVTSATMPDRRGNGDDSITLDDSDDVDSDAAAPTGLEDPQPLGLVGEVPHRRVAVYVHVRPGYVASFVEPRFLRYGRLLN
jgi:hypothetical protein